MRVLRLQVAVSAVLLGFASPGLADGLLSPGATIEQAIDHYVDARLKEEGVTSAAQADGANLIRRLTLDLIGRIPTVQETQAFVAATDPQKRAKLVDRLLASPGFVRHQATELDVLLMQGTRRGSLREYLLKAVAENRPWDQIFRELLVADDNDPKRKGAGEFVKQRLRDPDKLTTEVSTLFFGVNISCAKCHDHPLVHDWKQDHFYGMKSFFSRTFDNGGFIAERDYGLVKFTTTSGKERQAKLMFLNGKALDAPGMREPSNEEQKKEKERFESYKKRKVAPPPPKWSARAQLAELALQPGQRDFFARSIVNRLWYRLYGYGLVMPVDQMHSENPPSYPELLAWLARDLVEHHYDLRRLIRGLVLSQAYARSSRWDKGEAPAPALFAVARVRPLTPMQLAVSLRLAGTDPESLSAIRKPEEFERRLESLEDGARGFANLFEQPGDNFQIGVSEALLFSNNGRLQGEFLADAGDHLIGRLKQLKDPRQRIDLAMQTVLSRSPTPEEMETLGAYLRQRQDKLVEACRQMVWALLTSPEFRFNY
jgi:hypothetical protein